MTDTCTTKDAARILGVTPRTVQLWCESGILKSWKTPGGHRRYDRQAIEALSAKQHIDNQYHPSEVDTSRPSFKILIIEDDALLLNLYNINITSWDLPIDLELSQDGYDGLLKIGAIKPDLLILDLSLPSIDGFQIIATLLKNKLLTKMRLIVVSGLAKSDLTNDIEKIKDVYMLSKPVDFKALKKEVQSCLNIKLNETT